MKKGAGASPLILELTPQNQNPSRGSVSGHPGKPILYFSWPYIVQTVCQRPNKSCSRLNPLETLHLTIPRHSEDAPIAPITYKISQVRLQYIQHSGESAHRDLQSVISGQRKSGENPATLQSPRATHPQPTG